MRKAKTFEVLRKRTSKVFFSCRPRRLTFPPQPSLQERILDVLKALAEQANTPQTLDNLKQLKGAGD